MLTRRLSRPPKSFNLGTLEQDKGVLTARTHRAREQAGLSQEFLQYLDSDPAFFRVELLAAALMGDKTRKFDTQRLVLSHYYQVAALMYESAPDTALCLKLRVMGGLMHDLGEDAPEQGWDVTPGWLVQHFVTGLDNTGMLAQALVFITDPPELRGEERLRHQATTIIKAYHLNPRLAVFLMLLRLADKRATYAFDLELIKRENAWPHPHFNHAKNAEHLRGISVRHLGLKRCVEFFRERREDLNPKDFEAITTSYRQLVHVISQFRLHHSRLPFKISSPESPTPVPTNRDILPPFPTP